LGFEIDGEIISARGGRLVCEGGESALFKDWNRLEPVCYLSGVKNGQSEATS